MPGSALAFAPDNTETPPARRLDLPGPSSGDSRPQTSGESSANPARHGGGMTLAPSTNGRARDAMADRPPTHSPSSSTDAAPKIASDASQNERAFGNDEPPAAGDGRSPASGLTPSQRQLNEYRERLARDLERRELSARGLLPSASDKTRISPIQEETMPDLPAVHTSTLTSTSTVTSTSTESGNTVRAGMTPGGTPSYPFPRMSTGGVFKASGGQRPFSLNSPTGPRLPQGPPNESSLLQDRVLSDTFSETSTPVSNFTFYPAGASPHPENFDFPTPNLYDLSLMLTAEPTLDAWWTTVVQIMKDVYKAERVTLAVPADSTDIENVPWGQKATYNEHQGDELSLAYMARGSSAVMSSDLALSDVPAVFEDAFAAGASKRPGLSTRHSYTSYEDKKGKSGDSDSSTQRRSFNLTRGSSQFLNAQGAVPPYAKIALNKSALEEHDAEEEQQNIPSWEVPFAIQNMGQGRVLPVLQALDYEADPLIDHNGVMRVLERGRPVALTRNYPYLVKESATDPSTMPKTGKSGSSDSSLKKSKKQPSESSSKLTGIFATSSGSRGSTRVRSTSSDKAKTRASRREEEAAPRPPTPQYEEYEQAPPSPWSQSPAPSPAVRTDTKENPFFTDAMVDEESFNPGSAPLNYTDMRPPEAIGVDNSWTVLHIPLSHVLLSKPIKSFKLDATNLEQKTGRGEASESREDAKASGQSSPSIPKPPAPIAILSILSPIIPYPSSLRHSLEHLAPHMATSFSLCRHYSNLETEMAGMQRRRPSTAGFGAVALDGRPMHNMAGVVAEDVARQPSRPGSITSPSDYSGVSKSMTDSPVGTPGWDQGSLSYFIEKRQPILSPGLAPPGGESYFNSRHKSGVPSRTGSSKDNSPGERRHTRLSTSKVLQDVVDSEEPAGRTSGEPSKDSMPSKGALLGDIPGASSEIPIDAQAGKSAEKLADSFKADPGNSHQGHTMLHSYGADFASTFQSLPPSSSVASRPHLKSAPSRAGSYMAAAVDLPPPSDRLKGLILDSLPAHVFVALPQTGEIVWVNSRYLSYRGQNVTDLAADPWGSIHEEDRDEYLKAWGHSLRTGEQFSRTVRIKRFDGAYRWFHARAVASKDKRGVIMQFLGSYMDIHDQHIAELKAARQEEIEVSEARHRLLANLIPQIIFTATEEDGITFANEQWLSYTGQTFDDSLGLGFLDYVHPEDLAKCRIPSGQTPTPLGHRHRRSPREKTHEESASSEATSANTVQGNKGTVAADSNLRGIHQALSRNNSSSSSSIYELPAADLDELAKKGVIKVATDSNGRQSYTTEVRLRSKAGEYRWHLIRCVEIDTIDFGSGASSYFGSATDINDHKLLEAKLKEAMDSKSRFLSNMSHEIRTPLIGISGMVSFLQDTILNEEQRDYTNTIQTSANSLIMIINDILDLSKVDAGMMKLKFEWFHTRSLIEDVNELVSTMAIAKRLELNYLVEADVPAWVKGDKVRIRQVLLNVIGNAIKFTSEGEVFSLCKVYTGNGLCADENEIILHFSITDTGRGFSAEEGELIFKPFSQIDGSSTRQHGGSGLGLVISRQLVELHGGKMEGSAIPGKGSTFAFTARFALPTPEDHPDLPGGAHSPTYTATSQQEPTETIPDDVKALPPPKHLRSTDEPSSSGTEPEFASPDVQSTDSSDPSVHSGRSHITDTSSVTSVNTGLARFSEAAKASGQDLSQMKLEMPADKGSPEGTATPGNVGQPSPKEFRPPIYSILIICPQLHSREATSQHIEMTLPKDVPHQITALATAEQGRRFIGGDEPINFTHIVINLPSAEAIISLMDQITKSQKIDKTTIVVLTDSVQRQSVMRLAAGTPYQELLSDNLVTFIYKPVKPSRFAVIFDPDKVSDVSIDRNRSTAQRMVEDQKASYEEIAKRMGNKGYKVLLVEDNPVNQKVLTKYLKKIGVEVEIAVDGVECTDMVLSKSHQHYSLILCDLHMPRKDGYQACREIRQWERAGSFPALPIIALSANVMSDVHDKCVAAGFNDYVTKPVDFIDLSRGMAKFF